MIRSENAQQTQTKFPLVDHFDEEKSLCSFLVKKKSKQNSLDPPPGNDGSSRGPVSIEATGAGVATIASAPVAHEMPCATGAGWGSQSAQVTTSHADEVAISCGFAAQSGAWWDSGRTVRTCTRAVVIF